jgi:hypothetical protein
MRPRNLRAEEGTPPAAFSNHASTDGSLQTTSLEDMAEEIKRFPRYTVE